MKEGIERGDDEKDALDKCSSEKTSIPIEKEGTNKYIITHDTNSTCTFPGNAVQGATLQGRAKGRFALIMHILSPPLS